MNISERLRGTCSFIRRDFLNVFGEFQVLLRRNAFTVEQFILGYPSVSGQTIVLLLLFQSNRAWKR